MGDDTTNTQQTDPTPDTTTSESTAVPDAYAQIVEQLRAQNAALASQNKLLNDQVVSLIANGGRVGKPNTEPAQAAQAESPARGVDVSMEALARYIGGSDAPPRLDKGF